MARRSRGLGKDKEERPKLTKEGIQKAKRLMRYIYPYRWSFIIGLIFLAMGSSVFMVFPWAAGELIDVASGNSKWGLTLSDIGIVLIVVLVIQSISSYLRILLFTNVSEKGMADIRKDLYGKLISQPIHFFEKNRVGELTSRSTADIQQLQDVFSITLAEFIRQIILLVFGIVIIAVTAWKLSLLMLATLPVVILIALVFGRYIRRLSRERQDQLAKTNTIIEETLQAISVVKAFTNEWFEHKRYGKSVDGVVNISLRFARIRGLFVIFIITALFGAMFFVLWSGATMVQSGEMEAGDLVTFITITAVVGGALASLGDFYTQILKAIGASERIIEILEKESEVDTKKSLTPIHIHGDIKFNNVVFNYPSRPDIRILDGINLNIEAGQKIALVGTSGAGKSTIVQLLLQFYKLETGMISVDEQPLTSYDISQLRQQIAIVPQDVILFGGTILENIRYGNQDATEEEVIEAAKKANAWSFIEQFPEQLETVVGERGVKLSGGQRQRVAIARAILKNPRILLLDEATSALDAESEKVVQDALNRLMEGRTSIIIAHRLATVREVDCIYVLDSGKIVEAGTHEELSHKVDGIYSQLAKLQFEAT
ncbi:MAG: ATP-binding cassette domain-containing protein [Saprospiraceae bacterium]|nr:ATP-binding cassette domain-containing protein [Saprospiraceae bacterium]